MGGGGVRELRFLPYVIFVWSMPEGIGGQGKGGGNCNDNYLLK